MRKIYYGTKSDWVYEVIREAIVTKEIKPGDRIIVNALAKQMGVSDIPVREALKRLQAHKFVEVTPYSGYSVRTMSIEEFEDVWLIRLELETLAARIAIKNCSNENIQELEELVSLMEHAVQEKDFKQYVIYNKRFHIKMYRLCNNERLVQLIKELWEETERASKIFENNEERIRESQKEHNIMLDALRTRDVELLIDTIRRQRSINADIYRQKIKREQLQNTSMDK